MSETIEIGNPADDPRGFRRALGHFATGVTIITAQHEGQIAGMTVNSFSSVSLDPPLVLWSIGKRSQSLALFEKSDHFAVNVLAADQMELATRFARSGPDKFIDVLWKPGIGGAPRIPGTSATFECSKYAVVDAGDHFIWLGRVEQFTRAERDPLLFTHGRFGLAVDYPVIEGNGFNDAIPTSPGTHQTTMLGLLWDAFSGMSHDFQADRDELGLSINQGRVLSLIERHPGAQIELIARKAFISPQGVEDAVRILKASGYVTVGPDGTWSVTPSGRQDVVLRRQRATAFEASQLKAFTSADLEVTCKGQCPDHC